MKKQSNKWYWIAILMLLGMLGYVGWYLSFNPQYFLFFLATAIIALVFVVAMALLPKYRKRLVEKVLEHHIKEKETGGWLYRYYRVALVVIIICALVFPVVSQYQLIASQYMPIFVLAFFIVNLAASVIFIAGFLKTWGKWGLLFVAVVFASVLLGILMGWMTKHG